MVEIKKTNLSETYAINGPFLYFAFSHLKKENCLVFRNESKIYLNAKLITKIKILQI